MAGFTPLSQAQFRSILVNQFIASLTAAGITIQDVPDTGPATIMGAAFDAISLLAAQQQYQDTFVQATSRLATIPANLDGTPNPDVASFVAPFGYAPLGGGFATSTTFALNLPSVSSTPVTVPTGVIFQRGDGLPWVLVADLSQPAYNGTSGFVIPPGQRSVFATATALSSGTIGTTDANATWTLYSAPGSIVAPIGSITNASKILPGALAETDAALKARFTLGMQNGKWGVITAIQSAVAGSSAGLTYSYGDHINPDGSYHGAWFTIVINIAGSSSAPSQPLIDIVEAAVNRVRAAGMEFDVVAPTLITPIITGNVAVRAGFVSSLVLAAVLTTVQSYVNGIGLNTDGSPSTLSYAQLLSNVIAVPGVNSAGTALLINGVAGVDVVAPFASQIVAPNQPVLTTS